MTDVDAINQSQRTGDYEGPPRQRVRLTYDKEERIKFISHQDEFRAWERTLRRANLPLLYKRGFNPQPHIAVCLTAGRRFQRTPRNGRHYPGAARPVSGTASTPDGVTAPRPRRA